MLKKNQKGISVYLAMVFLSILIAIGIGVSSIIVSQMKMIGSMDDSVMAFLAADTGIEHSLYEKRQVEGGDGTVSGVIGGATYSVTYQSDITGDLWQSLGMFKGVRRAIEISHTATFDFVLVTECGAISPCPGVSAAAGSAPFDFDLVNITGTITSGACGPPCTATFLTDGTDIGGGCYQHNIGNFIISACFSPASCDLNCTSQLDLDIINVPPPGESETQNIMICGQTPILTKCTNLQINVISN